MNHLSLRRPRTKLLAFLLPVLLCTGCSHSPSFNLLGSYFPSWIVCVVIAAVLLAVVHVLLAASKLVEEMWPLPVVYPAFIVFVSCTLWLCFFS